MSIKETVDHLARAVGITPPVDRSSVTLADGEPVTEDHKQLRPDGQQKGYLVLSADERSRGFVRPVRRSYIHAGPPGPQFPLRDLTEEERRRWQEAGYVKFETYPAGHRGAATGRFWTQAQLDAVDKGCGGTTKMGQSIAETYARDPKFYGSTFCVQCGTHLPVAEFVWLDNPDQRVGS